MVTETSRAFLESLFETAVAAAHPDNCLPPHLPTPPETGQLLILAAGKAAGSMAEVAERHYLDISVCSRAGSAASPSHGAATPARPDIAR